MAGVALNFASDSAGCCGLGAVFGFGNDSINVVTLANIRVVERRLRSAAGKRGMAYATSTRTRLTLPVC
jgi:hypothetical protein